jgi:glycerol-3-phosphate dehydrogenase subunit B
MAFASGLLDLMGVHPVVEKKSWRDPWTAIDALVRDEPRHPYARIKTGDIHAAFDEFLGFLDESGLFYCRHRQRNSVVLTPVGSAKLTYAVPESMWAGAAALAAKTRCLLVDFEGMKDYSARQIAAVLRNTWPTLRTARVAPPETGGEHEVFTARLAQALELPQNLHKLTEAIQPHVKDAQAVGLPAVLGLKRTPQIVADLEARFGVPVFEIPTLPVSVPGQRLKETLESKLPAKGIRAFMQQEVMAARVDGDGFRLDISDLQTTQHIKSRAVILASGRFLGGGLYARRQRIQESIFDLPVYQPGGRGDWHHPDIWDPRGHAVNRAGLEIDDFFRPLGVDGRPVSENLFAAGTILAHQDWMRMKCGSGIAIATAYGAVNSFLRKR